MSAVRGGRSGKSFLSVLKNVADAGGTFGESVKLPGNLAGFDVSGGEDLMKKMQRILGQMGITGSGKIMDQDLLDSLSRFLVDLGFDKGEVASLMKKLSLSADQGEIELADLFSGLGELGDVEVAEEEEEEMMAVSALPFLQTILADYGLTPGQVEGVLSKAADKSGISIPKLVSALKEVQEEFHRMEQGAGGIDVSKRGADFAKQLSGLMERIGIKGEKSEKEPLSFDDFIVELGKMVQEKPETGLSGAVNELEKIIAGLSSKKMEEAPADMAGALKGGERKGTDLRDKARKKENPAGLKAENADKMVGEKTSTMEEALSAGLEARRGIKGMDGEKVQAKVEPPIVSEKAETSPGAPGAGDGTVAFAEGSSAEQRTAEVISRPPGEKRGLPAYVMNQVSRQLLRSAADGQSELQIQIKPPRLGRLQMTIDNSSDGLKVSIIAEHQAARDMLLAHSNELRATLAEQGMRVDSIDVELSRNFDQTLADMRRDQGGGKRRGGRGAGSMAGVEGEDLAAFGIARATRLDEGDLDLVA